MSGLYSEKFDKLRDQYIWSGEQCALCMAMRGKKESIARDSQGNLCSKHYKLYEAEVEAIKAGKAKFPPGFNANAERVYLVDDNFWMLFHFLEAMVDSRELTEKEAREQMKVVIRILRDSPTPEERRQQEITRRQEEQKQMLPRTRLY